MAETIRGLLDTSVLIGLDSVDGDALPDVSAIAAVRLAELAAAPHAARDETERALRQDQLQWAVATWDPLPFDEEAARTYGRVFAAVRAAGRSTRPRPADLLIASTVAANDLPLYTRNPDGFVGLGDLATGKTV